MFEPIYIHPAQSGVPGEKSIFFPDSERLDCSENSILPARTIP
jgi:hypothetical protein